MSIRGIVRLVAAWSAMSVLGLTVATGAFGEEASFAGSMSLSGSPLVIEGAQLFSGAELLQEREDARLDNPEAVAAREASRTEYEGIDGEAAVELAERAFGIGRPSWTPTGSADGGHISDYLGEHAAIETTPEGKHLMVSSSLPLRSPVGSGHATAVSLALQDQGSSFTPVNPFLPVSFSKSAKGGVEFPLGVRIAPVVSGGGAQQGRLTGGRLVYVGVARDTDFIAGPVPLGAELSWQLRSQNSSQDDALTFSLPTGMTLRASSRMPGGVEVVKEGQAVIEIPPAVARDAQGSSLTTSYAISGSTLTVHVDLSGSVAFPVLVDPIVIGNYGTFNNANVWSGWLKYSNCGCFEFLEFYNLAQTGSNPGPPNGDDGEWYIFAPGEEGGASIARVDLVGGIHQAAYQSSIQAGIQSSNGSNPVWTFNGSRAQWARLL